ncbi:uncharacterized protein LOC133800368 [Humulus lupulus]|uniref:uncharacterized protein LOC133800368 n=1 Tax=Humulus lupulus TaxID=3486 RepID=UPI002B40725E|nr:uncharacterized protein LOC133800368 [Humulus lupulus]
MRAFLRVVDERVWMAVEDGWKCPTFVEDEVVKPKQMSLWTTQEMERANFNSKAMHALFNAVSTNQLKVIANCEIAKEAWEKLRIKNEGTDAVKKSRLRALAKAFENLSMEEEETVIEFHAKLCDISNASYALGKTYSNAKLVRKVLGVLPRKFMSKVTSIEGNVEELDLDELIRSLQNYEMSLTRWKKAECANTLKKKKALAATWSDSDEEKSSTSSLTSAKQQLESEKDGLEDTVKKLTKQLDEKDSEIYKLTADLIRARQSLEFIPPGTATINHTLQLQKPYGDQTSIGYKMLYKKGENLGIYDPSLSKNKEDKTRDDSMHNTFSPGFPYSTKRISVSSEPIKLNFEGRKTILDGQIHKERFVPICHFCNKRGHIRPRCYKWQVYLKAMIDRLNSFQHLNRFTGKLPSSEWKPKSDLNKNVALVAHTSLSAFQEEQWYVDSGCSRHMTGNRNVLVNYKEGNEGAVTFGDGNKGQIFGKGDLVLNGIAPLTEVLYVKGLKANLISISQLCDNDYTVSFSKTHCLVATSGCSVLTGNRTSDNCYALSNQVLCNRSFLDKPDLWHYRLGHLNFRDLKRIVKLQAVRGIPEMKVTRDRLCGPCQLRKQTKASHPPVNMLLTSRVLELIHVNLMGPMQNESLSGK